MDTSLSDGERSSELDQSGASDQLDTDNEGPDRKKIKIDPDGSNNSEPEDPLAKLLESPNSDKSRYENTFFIILSCVTGNWLSSAMSHTKSFYEVQNQNGPLVNYPHLHDRMVLVMCYVHCL